MIFSWILSFLDISQQTYDTLRPLTVPGSLHWWHLLRITLMLMRPQILCSLPQPVEPFLSSHIVVQWLQSQHTPVFYPCCPPLLGGRTSDLRLLPPIACFVSVLSWCGESGKGCCWSVGWRWKEGVWCSSTNFPILLQDTVMCFNADRALEIFSMLPHTLAWVRVGLSLNSNFVALWEAGNEKLYYSTEFLWCWCRGFGSLTQDFTQ